MELQLPSSRRGLRELEPGHAEAPDPKKHLRPRNLRLFFVSYERLVST